MHLKIFNFSATPELSKTLEMASALCAGANTNPSSLRLSHLPTKDRSLALMGPLVSASGLAPIPPSANSPINRIKSQHDLTGDGLRLTKGLKGLVKCTCWNRSEDTPNDCFTGRPRRHSSHQSHKECASKRNTSILKISAVVPLQSAELMIGEAVFELNSFIAMSLRDLEIVNVRW